MLVNILSSAWLCA